MPTTEPTASHVSDTATVLLTGASGYVGGRLIPLLEAQPITLRCLARDPDKLRASVKETTQVVRGDVLQYLLAAKDLPHGESRIVEVGCPEVVTYGDLIREYARQRNLRRRLIFVPILTPYLSGLWLALVTPATYEVGRHLIEGLKNSTVVRDTKAMEAFSVRPLGVSEAVRLVIDES